MQKYKQSFFVCLILMVGYTSVISAQSLNEDKIELEKFLTRMYNASPFEGVKVVTDYENSYLLSVVTLDKEKYKTESVANRVAGVKAMSQASTYFNGASITTDLIIKTTEKSDGSVETAIIEDIREKSLGYVKALELLTTFTSQKEQQIYMYIKKLDQLSKQN